MGSIFLHPILQRKETWSLVCSRTVGSPYFGSKNQNPPTLDTSLFAAALHSVATTYPSLQTRYGRAWASPILRTSAYRTCWPDALSRIEKQATEVAAARGLPYVARALASRVRTAGDRRLVDGLRKNKN